MSSSRLPFYHGRKNKNQSSGGSMFSNALSGLRRALETGGVRRTASIAFAVVVVLVLVVYFFNEVTGRNLHRVYKEFSGVLQGAEERRRFPTVEDYAKNAIPLAYKMIGAYRTGSDDSSSHSYRTMARPERGLMRRRTVANRIPSSPIELKPGYFPAQPYGSAKFTVYIITYDRDKTLRYIIRHYGKSHLVDRIIISWNNIGRKPPAADSFDVDCPIHIIAETRDSLNNRFLPRDFIQTDAILTVDDDFLVPLDILDFAFLTWQQFPATTVGFSKFVRSHSRRPTFSSCGQDDQGSFSYSAECYDERTGERKYYSDGPFPSYSIALDSAIFFHRDYLKMYSDETNKKLVEARRYVDEVRNCEDLVFPMVVAEHSKMPPIAVNTYSPFTGKSLIAHIQHHNSFGSHIGLNRLNGHYHARSKCLNKLTELFGEALPLLHTRIKVDALLPNEVL